MLLIVSDKPSALQAPNSMSISDPKRTVKMLDILSHVDPSNDRKNPLSKISFGGEFVGRII